MKKLGKWLAGILAGIIITAVGVYIGRPKPVTVFEGMVYAGSTPVARAMVALDLKGAAATNGAIHDFTNENGSYRFELTGVSDDDTATLQVTANGYQASELQSLSSPLKSDIHVDFPLNPVPVAPPAGLGANVAAHVVQPARFQIPVYVAKGATQAMKAVVK